MKHTAGPWRIQGDGVRDDGGFICFMTKPSRFTGQDKRYIKELQESAANAALIAAAPTMYAYIEKMANAGWGEAQDIRDQIEREG